MRPLIVRYGLAALCLVSSGSSFGALLGQPVQEAPKSASKASNSSSRIRLTAAPSTELSVDAHMEPIKDSSHGFHSKWKELAEFRPAIASKSYKGDDFGAFLPGDAVAIGEIWPLAEKGLLKF